MSASHKIFVFKLPDIGEGIAESEIAQLHVAVGDVVAEDQQLIDMLTDKAAVELSSPVAGRVVKIHGEPGDKIPVGGALVTIEVEAEAETGAQAAPTTAPAAAAPAANTAAAAAPAPKTGTGLFVFKLPDIGEGIAESEIAQLHVAVGDIVAEDQQLIDMLTDKAAVELSSPVAGRVVKIHGAPGDKIAVGGALVTIEVEGDAEAQAAAAPATAGAAAQSASPASSRKAAPPADSTPPHASDRLPVAASPATRKRARELGIDLAQVAASGPSGRITRDDLERHAAQRSARTATPASTRAASVDDDAVEQIKVIGLRRKIAEAMQRTKQRIPHFAYVEEIDCTELEALRVHLNETHKDRGKLTLLPLLIQALVRAVPAFPQVNATYDDEAGVVSRHRALHVGIATQTPNGLVVPVLKHAQRHDLWGRASEIKRLADAARAGKATRDELSGSSITITSLGALGGIVTTPVINAPEVAIIGVNKLVERPVVKNGQIVVRSIMNLSSSFDHRIVDGYDAAQFIQRVKALLEHPATLFID